MTHNNPPSKIELLIVLALFLVGFGLRVWDISSVGLDHFDEGVYAFSGLGLTDPNQPHRLYPTQVQASPPIYIGMVGISYIIAGEPSDTAAITVNVILGTLTILLIWWICRSWFNAPVGIAAAALLTFSEYHISLSRTALTDIAFSFFFLIALATIAIAVQRDSIRWAIIAGLAVGLSWNTKYHGFFALIITGMALVSFYWKNRSLGLSLKRLVMIYLTIGVVAGICYLPWALYIQFQEGGYLALAQYQRTMMDRRWFNNLWLQIQQQLFFEGTLSRASVFIALSLVYLVSKTPVRPTIRFLSLLLLLVLITISVGSWAAMIFFSMLSIPFLFNRLKSFPTWLVLSWLILLFFTTPFYIPYARLVLPFTIGIYITGSLGMVFFVERFCEAGSFSWGTAIAALMAIIVGSVALIIPDYSNPWAPSRSVAEAASSLASKVPASSRVIVIGEPELAFYLHISDLQAFERTEDPEVLANLNQPVYLITGVYAQRAPDLRNGLTNLENRLELLGIYPMMPKDIRILDDFRPPKTQKFITNPDNTYDLKLYILHPSPLQSP